jgi:hypothetical protein
VGLSVRDPDGIRWRLVDPAEAQVWKNGSGVIFQVWKNGSGVIFQGGRVGRVLPGRPPFTFS